MNWIINKWIKEERKNKNVSFFGKWLFKNKNLCNFSRFYVFYDIRYVLPSNFLFYCYIFSVYFYEIIRRKRMQDVYCSKSFLKSPGVTLKVNCCFLILSREMNWQIACNLFSFKNIARKKYTNITFTKNVNEKCIIKENVIFLYKVMLCDQQILWTYIK